MGGDEIGLFVYHKDSVRDVLIEKVLQLRCESYLAQARQKLLTQTITEIDQSKKNVLQANTRLREIDQLKNLFLASLTHEFRTPLSTIMGFTDLILQEEECNLDDKQKGRLSRIHNTVVYLNDLISDLLDVSKIESDEFDSFPEKFDLVDVTSELASDFTNQIREKNINLIINAPPTLVVNMDKRRFMQCIINIINNAIKFTENGSIEISIKQINEKVEISIKDSGIGIEEDDMQYIFLPFMRAKGYVGQKDQGAGLGLYITKKIVNKVLRGEILVDSSVEKGSNFTMLIPGNNFVI